MWNFDAVKKIEEFETKLKMYMAVDKDRALNDDKRKEMVDAWQLKIEGQINALQTQISGLLVILQDLQKSIVLNGLKPEQEQRLKELELWQSKLHSLMIEKTPSGNKEKLNKNFNFLKKKI